MRFFRIYKCNQTYKLEFKYQIESFFPVFSQSKHREKSVLGPCVTQDVVIIQFGHYDNSA